MWIDRFEKLERLLLWLSLSFILIGTPIGIANQYNKTEVLEKELKKAKDDLVAQKSKKEDKIARVSTDIIGNALLGFDEKRAQGIVTFTNVSQQKGFLCIWGYAVNKKDNRQIRSIPTCEKIEPYQSQISIVLQFAGGEFYKTCEKMGVA